MFDLNEMVIQTNNKRGRGKSIDKDHIERIKKLFDKPSVEPAPIMERERVYQGDKKRLNDTMIFRGIYKGEELEVTKWKTINEKPEFAKGITFYFPKQKIKVSAFFKENGEFYKYYCEVDEVDYKKKADKYIFRDLIVDVDLYEDGEYVVLDEKELEKAVKISSFIQKKDIIRNLITAKKVTIRRLFKLKRFVKRYLVTQEKANEILKVKDNIIRKIKEGQILPEWCIEMVEKGTALTN